MLNQNSCLAPPLWYTPEDAARNSISGRECASWEGDDTPGHPGAHARSETICPAFLMKSPSKKRPAIAANCTRYFITRTILEDTDNVRRELA